jgi:hypothetical protein
MTISYQTQQIESLIVALQNATQRIASLKAQLANQTDITVQGLVYSISPVSNITLNVTINQISNLYAWQAKLLFDPTVLEPRVFAIPYPNDIYEQANTHNNRNDLRSDADFSQNGSVIVNATLLTSEAGFTGSGVLCQLQFTAIASGATSITLSEPDTWVLNMDYVTIPANITLLAQYSGIPLPELYGNLPLPPIFSYPSP